MLPVDPFPPSEFDSWAENYDHSTRAESEFPFIGYERVLQTVVSRADIKKGMSILDLGAGTANLALLFDQLGCELYCTDFSPRMLEKARLKLPNAHFILHDLRHDFPVEINRRFDCIVSAYVFHHFELEKKVSLCQELIERRLNPGGKLVIADLSFLTYADKERFQLHFDDWEDEFYWFADEAVAALSKAGIPAAYEQVSPCAGVYFIGT
jgi:putative AdoMet-dependent methyltransferase